MRIKGTRYRSTFKQSDRENVREWMLRNLKSGELAKNNYTSLSHNLKIEYEMIVKIIHSMVNRNEVHMMNGIIYFN